MSVSSIKMNVEGIREQELATFPPPQQHSQPTHHHPMHGHHGGIPGQHQIHGKMGKNYAVIIYTVVVCLSCLYLNTQVFAPILNDRCARYMAWAVWFDVFMCLWCYYVTIKTPCKLQQLQKAPSFDWDNEKFSDKTYNPTAFDCHVCKGPKPNRVSHCSTCGQCVVKMDHHCIWTQTCIGYNNQKSFYLFTLYMVIGDFQFWYFCVRVLRQHQGPLLQLMEPGDCILWVFTALSAFFVGIMLCALLVTHTLMILTNFRTLDGMKGGKMFPLPFCRSNMNVNKENFFDRGQVQNIKTLLGSNWLLWFVPTPRKPQREYMPQPLPPHPDKAVIYNQTDLFDVQKQFGKYMRVLNKQISGVLVGKRVRIGERVYRIMPQGSTV